MTMRRQAQLLSRARAALETPGELDADTIRHLIEDLASAEGAVTNSLPGDDEHPPRPAAGIDQPSDRELSNAAPLTGDICQLPAMTSSDAASIGFAIFNHVPTLPIDIPDGRFTITARTSEGRRATFYFGPYRMGGPPRFIDIQFHDSNMTVPDAGGSPTPVFDMLTIAEKGRHPYDSRKVEVSEKPSIAVLLLHKPTDTV